MLHEFEILTHFKKLGLHDTKLAELLGILLNGDKDNIRKTLTIINVKDSKVKSASNKRFQSSRVEKIQKEVKKCFFCNCPATFLSLFKHFEKNGSKTDEASLKNVK